MHHLLSGTQNLLFDLGGVIIDLDSQRCLDALVALGDSRADEMLGLYVQQGPFLDLESGKLSAGEFLDCMRRRIGRPVSDREIVEAVNAFLVALPVERLQLLRRLRKQYKVFLLSNTNPIMFDTRIAEFFRQEGLEMSDYFDDIFVSYKLGAIKPDREIFEKVVAQSQMIPQETLFFDDSRKNLEAAAALGFKTWQVTDEEGILKFFND